MKHALAFTFLSSMTCLAAWDAEAAPNAPPEAHHPHHPHGIKATAKADHHAVSKETTTKKGHGKTDHRAPKRIAKSDPHAAAKGTPTKAPSNPTLSGGTKADFDLPLNAKPVPAPAAKGNVKPNTHHATNPKGVPTKLDPHVPAKGHTKPAADPHAAAKKHGPQRSYWLAADPHVPLAFVDGNAIHSVGEPGKTCGVANRWAKPKSRWNAVDAWGQLAGSFEVNGSDFYDATRCREVFFKGKEGTEPHAVFVSADSTWRPSPKLEWTPEEVDLKEFDHFTSTLASLWVNQKPFGKPIPLAKRVMFFQVPAAEDSNVHRPTRWAVVGGPILLVAYLGEKDHWKVASVQAPLGLADSYQPVGVFDMNGDKLPEIIYHSNDGPSFGDSVLSLDVDTLTWSDAAVSLGGATL